MAKRINLNCRWLTKEQAEAEGWHPHAGYYLPSEAWMAANVEKDLIAAKRPYIATSGNSRGVLIWTK